MTTTHRLLAGVAWSHLMRGATLTVLAALAITWPESSLRASMRLAGAVVSLSGLVDVGLSLRLRPTFRAWPLLVGNGLACVAFGILTAEMGGVSPAVSMPLAALWLLLYGIVAGLLSLALWPLARTRFALASVAAGCIATAVVARWMVELPQVVSIYLGAFFAVLLGVLHIAAGVWIRRMVMPEFAPTTQADWMPAHGDVAGTRGRPRSTDLPLS